jgi:hypothetical protein
MFAGCSIFDQSVSNFVTSVANSLEAMFANCLLFSRKISMFDTSLVQNMAYMLYGCQPFDDDLSTLNIVELTTAEGMLAGTSFSNDNYDKLLVAWDSQTEKANVQFHAGSAKYSEGAPAQARARLVSSSWTITDGGAL